MYKYDPSGSNPDNVVKERFCISSNFEGMQVWVPHAAPFFTKDLKIKNLFTGEILTYGRDYVFSDDLSLENKVVESNIYNSVLFIGKERFGMYEGEYRTVGGGLVFETRTYLVNLARHLVDPKRVLYSYVVNVPKAFPPDHHLHDWSDYRNKQYIGQAISTISQAVRASDNDGIANLEPLTKELDDIERYLNSINLKAHTETIDAHHMRAADIGALPVGVPAEDAFSLFGKKLSELTQIVKQTQEAGLKLDDYVNSESANNIVKAIILKGEATIGTPGNESTMRIVGDNVFFESLGSIDFASNVDNDGTVTLRAGRNELVVESSPYGYQVDCIRFNGKYVITAENIDKHLKTITLDEQTIVTKNNDIAIFSGDGSRQNPLKIEMVLQDANEIQAGIAKFTRSWGQDKLLVMESDMVRGLVTDLSGYVPRERKINGYSITDNIVIPKSDPNINLGNVDNTSDVNKPVSTAQAALLANYSDKLHTHSSYTPPTASPSTVGIAKLNVAWTGSETGFVAPAAFAFIDDALDLSRGRVATYAGESIDPNAIYGVIRDVPTIKRGRAINLVSGEQYIVIK